MTVAVIIVAAGRGTRLGADIPKQYIPLNGHCALRRSIEVFLGLEQISYILPVIHGDDRMLCAQALEGLSDPRVLSPAEGGKTRAETVRHGLEQLARQAPEQVLIHDAARPFVPPCVIEALIDALRTCEGACAALPVVDALWRAVDTFADAPVVRDSLWRAQTPQGFRYQSILRAHRAHAGDGTDDVAVAQEAGMQVRMIEGSEQSYKITTNADLKRALKDTAI